MVPSADATRVIEHAHPHSHAHRAVVNNPSERRWFTHTHEHRHPDPTTMPVFTVTRAGGWHNGLGSHDSTHWHELVEDSQ